MPHIELTNMDQPFQLLLQNLSTAVLCLDHRLRVNYANDAAENLLDVSLKQSLDQPLTSFFEDAGNIEQILYEALQTQTPYTARKALLRLLSGDQVTVDYTVSTLNDAEAPLLVLEISPLDRFLRIDRDEAIRLHEQTTRQMIRGLAHEVKNPLGGIRGTAQLLARELDEAGQEYTNIIIEESDRLTALVDRLLGPNALPALRETNIYEVLERAARLTETEDPRLTVERDYDPSIPQLEIDPDLISQALLNILRNAAQALTNTDNPTIRIVTRTERQFTIGNVRHRIVLRIDIIDNGPGIPDALREQMFYPMISGRPDGTGLGLSFAQSIVNQHRGLIEVDSRPGCTDFTIILPLEPVPSP